MEKKKIYLLIFSIIFILSLVWEQPLFLQTAFAEPSVTIIANISVQENSISAKNLKKIYLGKKTTWEDKSKIFFVICEDTELHKSFLKIIKKTPSQFSNHWKKQIFTGKGKAPLKFETKEALIEYIATTDGAIGYILGSCEADNVKTLLIID
ncbi:MAG: hypothetical protein K8S23_16035 [Candidatus Cloacimonetes bacterium]|nr:hypothetical protein [Candidatus Cloacimonadota bacterium]